MAPTLSRRLTAEGAGSALLACAVVGSGIAAERLAGGNAAVALLGNTLATVSLLAVLIVVFAPLSGAHFNPLVSLVARLRGELTTAELAARVATQLVAMVAGVALAHAMFGLALVQRSMLDRSSAGEALGESLATFVLIVTVLASSGRTPNAAAVTVPAAIAAGYWFTSSTSFANPAITIARSLSDSFAGIDAGSVPLFVAAQCAGALAAWVFARWLWADVTRNA